MRVGIEFKKEGRVRFLSHLELMRLWERAMRRAGLPLAFSEGFNPHPLFSLAMALAVGVSSSSEYLDVEFSETMDTQEIARQLGLKLPEGLAVNKVKILRPGAPSLAARIDRASYRLEAFLARSLESGELEASLEKFWQAPVLEVPRKTKSGVKIYDPRKGIYRLTARVAGDVMILEMLVQVGGRGNTRPEEVARALVQASGLPLQMEAMRQYRTGLYISSEGGNLDPLEALS